MRNIPFRVFPTWSDVSAAALGDSLDLGHRQSTDYFASITTLEVLHIAMDGEDDAPHIYFKMTLARVLRELNDHHDEIDRLIVGQVPKDSIANPGRARSQWLARHRQDAS